MQVVKKSHLRNEPKCVVLTQFYRRGIPGMPPMRAIIF
jgi:hypothetical protein